MDGAVKKLAELTGHNHVTLVNSGNAAILAALYIARQESGRKAVLIPDQGGWISFRTYPQIFGFKAIKVKTYRGLIDLKDLAKKSKKAAAFLVTSFAGYHAEQPMEEISEICRKSGCLLIEDASGSIGLNDGKLCNGRFSDIIVASFGLGKVVDLGNGGFISVSNKDHLEKAGNLLSALKFSGDEEKLASKLENAGRRLALLMKTAEKVKDNLKGFDVLHPEKRSINVIIGFRNNKEKEKIINYCATHNYEYVICPKDIRVNEKAISIEIKRIGQQ